jgi:hypothetical protein
MLSYSEKYQAMVNLLQSIFQPHQPTWDDCQQIFLTFFNTEERQRILTEARRWLQGQAPAGTLDVEAWAREAVPDARATWDFNTAEVPSRRMRRPYSVSCRPPTRA